jgi:hypothetical protein
MLYARVTKFNEAHLPRGAEVNKWYQVKEGYCWFPSGHRFGYRFIDFGGSFVKAESVEVCIVGEKVNKVDNSLAEFVEVEEVYCK